MNFVFDIDGTLCFNGVEIDNRITTIIKQLESEGHNIIFASARPIRDLLPIVPDFSNNTLIGGNGSIVSKSGDIEVLKYIPEDTYKIILDIIYTYKLDYIIDGEWNYASKVNPQNSIFNKLDPGNLASKIEINSIIRPIKIIMLDILPEAYKEVQAALSKLDNSISVITHQDDNSLDITSKNVNKYTALDAIYENIPYVAFGNDSNDYEMLKNASTGFYVTTDIKNSNQPFESDHINLIDKSVTAVVNAISTFTKNNN